MARSRTGLPSARQTFVTDFRIEALAIAGEGGDGGVGFGGTASMREESSL
jgi:hypothetical protein